MAWEWFIPVGLVGLCVAAMFIASLWEKQLVKTYAPGPPIDPSEFGSYLINRYNEMLEMGLVHLSFHRHTRFKLIAIFGYTPDRTVLVHSGEGKVGPMHAKQSWLYTRLIDGKVLVTSDNFDEGDPSGLMRSKRVINANLPKLMSTHRSRCERDAGSVLTFNEQECYKALEQFSRSRAERLVQLGRARWLDDEHARWRYTLSGGVSIIGQWFRQLGVGLMQFWRVR